MEEHTPETIALDLEYHIRHIVRYVTLAQAIPAVPVGVFGNLMNAAEALSRARVSMLDGLSRTEANKL